MGCGFKSTELQNLVLRIITRSALGAVFTADMFRKKKRESFRITHHDKHTAAQTPAHAVSTERVITPKNEW